MKLENYKHIIWDWNGTLFNDIDMCVDIMNKMLIKYNLEEMSLEKYKNIFTVPVINYYEKLGFNINDGTFTIVGKEFIVNYEERRDEAELYTDALTVLQKIQDSGISQSILSGYHQETLEEIIPHYGLEKYFFKLVGLDNVYGGSKIDNGKHLITQLGLDGNEVLFIGDTAHDFEVASELGADCILITHGHQSEEKLAVCNTPIINSLSELL